MIESNAQENVFAVQSREQRFQRSPPTQLRKPRYNCFKSGDLHRVSECPFYNNKCNDCNRFGHKEGYCQSSQNHSQNFKPKWKPGFKNRNVANTKVVKVNVFNVNNHRRFVDITINAMPVHLQEAVKSELDRLEQLGIITPVIFSE